MNTDRVENEPTMEDVKIPIFVYGTLMKGERFHEEYMQGARLLGKAMVSGFELYDLGHYPAMIRSEAGIVKGEVYQITSRMLASIDGLEGEGWKYKRIKQTVYLEEKAQLTAYCYVYQRKVYEENRIPQEHQPWSSFSLYRRTGAGRRRKYRGVEL